MATVTSPLTHAQFDGGAVQFRQAFALLPGAILLRMVERMSMRSTDALLYLGDLAGAGSDTIRTRYYDSIGWGASFSSVAETATPARSSIAAEIEDVAIGRWYLGYSQTYMDMILRASGELSLWELAGIMADAWEATWQALLCTTQMSAAADYGSSGVDMSLDDHLDAIGYFRTLDGFMGPIFAQLHGQQLVDLAASVRAEPSFQFPEIQANMQAVRGAGFQFDFVGASVYQSNRVNSSGGNRHGAYFGRGAMAWAIAGTQELAKHLNMDLAVVVPQLGLAVERSASGNGAVGSLDANAFLGMDINDDDQLRGMVTDA